MVHRHLLVLALHEGRELVLADLGAVDLGHRVRHIVEVRHGGRILRGRVLFARRRARLPRLAGRAERLGGSLLRGGCLVHAAALLGVGTRAVTAGAAARRDENRPGCRNCLVPLATTHTIS